MYTYVYIYMYVYIYVYVCIYIYIYTRNPSTGVCPAELLFQRKLRTKLPELREVAKFDEEVRD